MTKDKSNKTAPVQTTEKSIGRPIGVSNPAEKVLGSASKDMSVNKSKKITPTQVTDDNNGRKLKISGFKFTAANENEAKKHLAKYPDGKKSAVMPILDIAQRQNNNWLSTEVIEYVAAYMDMPPIRVREIATFYEMYNTEPVGENVVWVCRTTPCWLRGSDAVLDACKKNMKVEVGETSKDGKFTLREMECLGACVNAPILWVGNDYYEDVDAKDTDKILNELRKGNRPAAGSLKGRSCAAPEGFKPKEVRK
jgi:NADH-quinone oxidoreductase subunit E